MLASLMGSAAAGQGCQPRALDATQLQSAAVTAEAVRMALEERDAPVALVARVGTDLSAHGLVYSHLGWVVRDRPEGRWSVVHLLNGCGSNQSDLYVEGLVNFFADDLVEPRARLIWLKPEVVQAVLDDGETRQWRDLHETRYNLLARPDRLRSQNSTGWVVEVLAAAMNPGPDDRASSQAWLAARHYQPDTIHVPYAQRVVGGLFGSNVEFTEHSVKDRLAGRYEVSTVRSIVRLLEQHGWIEQQAEWLEARSVALGAL